MYRKSIIYILLLLLTSCTDLLDFDLSNPIGNEGEMQFTFDIPGLVVHKSRSNAEIDPEYRVEDILVLIYSGEEGNGPSQIEHIYNEDYYNSDQKNTLRLTEDGKIMATFRLVESLRGKTDLRFYFIANSPESDLNLAESVLKTSAVSIVMNGAQETGKFSLVMCGNISLKNLQEGRSVTLMRNAAKVTVSDNKTEHIKQYPYMLFGDAKQSPRMACLSEGNIENAIEVSPSSEDVDKSNAAFFHPTINELNDNGIGGKLFIIAKLNYNGTEYFYRLDFVDKDENSYINAMPNHWYQFIVTKVLCAGYKTPSEAALHPFNGLKYEIHDHAPVSYNMTSDGFRELGVSNTIEYTGSHNDEGTWSDKELYVKFFSKDQNELPATSEQVVRLIRIPSWIELSVAESITSEDITGGDGNGNDQNDSGKVYRLKMRFKPIDGTGSLEDKITVSWRGLVRDVPVIWTRDFTGADISSASLNIIYNGSTTTIQDYWGFLSSTDELAGAKNNALWGIQTKANNGKIRNQGFHFPVMYGVNGDLATYSYNLVFDKLDKLRKDNVIRVEVSTPTDPCVTCTENSNNSEVFSFTISRNNNDQYNYKIGVIDFTFFFKDGTSTLYSYRTYHTGFFHKDSQKHRLDMKDNANYYYYEVVPVMIDGQMRYMLDRNLAAKSAEMYIRNGNGSIDMGNPDAAGGYYSVAYQETGPQGQSLYRDPVLYDNTSERVSPPGYRIPNKNVWGGIITSSYFHNEVSGGKYPAYYDTDNPSIGKIYFPKQMLYMSGSIKGENRTGYYWTSTVATGTEKDEIGKWLNMFVLSEKSTSYINGCVKTYIPGIEYGASVRCINDIQDNKTTNVTSFNITGATHVYLYKETNGVRISTTAWPGHSVGNFATMSNERWFGFSYESTQFDPKDLYVIFNFVDKNGVIYTYSQGNDGGTIRTTHLTPSECNGWKVIGDINDNIRPTSGYLTTEGIELIPANETANKNWWRCGITSTNSPFVFDYKTAPRILYMIGDATAGAWDYNAMTEVTADSNTPGIYKWEGKLKIGEFKASFSQLRNVGFWNSYFLRPRNNRTPVTNRFELKNSPMIEKRQKNDVDNKWYVEVPGRYALSFDINSMTFNAKYLESVPEGKNLITVVNDKNWSNVYLYYWRSVDNNNYNHPWPGTLMNKVPGSENKYQLEIPEYADMIIFHNGSGAQTADITLNDKYDYDHIPLP